MERISQHPEHPDEEGPTRATWVSHHCEVQLRPQHPAEDPLEEPDLQRHVGAAVGHLRGAGVHPLEIVANP